MIVTATLDESQLVETEIITESETYLNEHGYQTDAVRFDLVVNQKPHGENSGYVVKTVETTAVPFDVADVVSDTLEIQICSCAAYRYSDGLEDLEDRDTLEWHACKHCSKVDKTLRAESDNDQTELL